MVSDTAVTRQWEIPAEASTDGRECSLKIFPSILPQIVDSLQGMLRMPYGCFEQTTSITYPNILIIKYLKRSGQLSSEMAINARKWIKAGYQRLLTFEVGGNGGYSWYGSPPAKLKLSAFALMIYTDMKWICPVDSDVIDRTRQWLEKRQKADGSWGSLAETAFVTAALAGDDAGSQAVRKAVRYLVGGMRKSRNIYDLAWCANALVRLEPVAAGEIVARLYTSHLETDAGLIYWNNAGSGLFYSCGRSGDIEITALILNAMAKLDRYPAEQWKILLWLLEQKNACGFWGSTQATVQTLQAMLNARITPETFPANEELTLRASVNNRIQTCRLNASNFNNLQYLNFATAMRNGNNRFTVSAPEKLRLMSQLVVTYYLPQPLPVTAKTGSGLELVVAYDRSEVRVGETLKVKLFLRYSGRDHLPMGIIIIPIPPGFTVRNDDLEQLKLKGEIDQYSVAAEQITLYVPQFSRKPLIGTFGLRAVYPVKVTTGSAIAYPYYQPEISAATQPQTLLVKPVRQGAE